MGYEFEKNEFILFQGDSITDTGRSYLIRSSLGDGYPAVIAQRLCGLLPGHNIQYLNKGVSGNRIFDLKRRFHRDCLALHPFPSIVSVLIGINDTWRIFDMGLASPIPHFEQIYRELLDRIREKSKFTRLILLSPYVLEDTEDKRQWREDVDARRDAVARIAHDYGARYIDLQRMFDDAMEATGNGPLFYTVDGVHPSPEGHALIAERWIEAFAAK
ncbi:MAG: SGNH/GDSL hydrolase family protein [Acetanaerobacterium sp.]